MGEWLRVILYCGLVATFMFMLASIADASVTCIHNDKTPTSAGIGRNEVVAWTNMVESCVMQQVKEYEKIHGKCPEERYILFIDSCVNRKCTKVLNNEEKVSESEWSK